MLLSLTIFLPLINGCATQRAALGSFVTAITPAASALLDTAVGIAVTAELLKDPATTHAKAVAFSAVAQQVVASTSNPTATLAQLETVLNQQLVALAPDPVTKAAIVNLIGGLQEAINNVITTNAGGALTQGTLVSLTGIAKQVIQVCAFY